MQVSDPNPLAATSLLRSLTPSLQILQLLSPTLGLPLSPPVEAINVLLGSIFFPPLFSPPTSSPSHLKPPAASSSLFSSPRLLPPLQSAAYPYSSLLCEPHQREVALRSQSFQRLFLLGILLCCSLVDIICLLFETSILQTLDRAPKLPVGAHREGGNGAVFATVAPSIRLRGVLAAGAVPVLPRRYVCLMTSQGKH